MNQTTDSIITILERQAAALAALADLAQTQRDAARDGDIDAVDRLLDQRRSIVEALAQVEQELARVSDQLAQATSVGGPARELLSGSKAIAGQIAAHDAEAMADLIAHKDDVSGQLADTAKARRAGVAYSESVAPAELRISA